MLRAKIQTHCQTFPASCVCVVKPQIGRWRSSGSLRVRVDSAVLPWWSQINHRDPPWNLLCRVSPAPGLKRAKWRTSEEQVLLHYENESNRSSELKAGFVNGACTVNYLNCSIYRTCCMLSLSIIVIVNWFPYERQGGHKEGEGNRRPFGGGWGGLWWWEAPGG